MGTPDFAVPSLAGLVGRGHDVVGVYTRAPQPAGRGMELRQSPVEHEARRLGLAVLSPPSLRTSGIVDAFRAHRAEAAVVVAYGLILPRPILDVPPLGCFNLHASLLPRWRGAAPINRAIMAGDAETAVAVMKMEPGLDTGPVALTQRVAIGPDMTAGQLHDRLAQLGAGLVGEAIDALERGALVVTPQDSSGVTYAAKIDKAETRIDWSKPWQAVHDHARGLSPHPGAWFALPGAVAVRIKVLQTTRGEGEGEPGTVLDANLTIACGSGAVRILTLQRAGRAPMTADQFLLGTPIAAGTRLA